MTTAVHAAPRHALSDDTLQMITAQARQMRPGTAALAVIGGLLFTLGWVTAKSFGVLFLATAWCFAAGRMGWRQARGMPLAQPDIRAVLDENERLRNELRRVQA